MIIAKNIFRLMFGIALFSIGIVCTINANLGIAPWDTFHQGINLHSNLTFGQASIVVGLILLIINYILREHIGLGTILNIFFIGIIIDILFKYEIIPVMDTFISGFIMIIIGMIIISFGSYYYIGAGFGAGPRDGLMVGLVKKTNLPIGLIRAIIEVSVLVIGYSLGGKVGIGTLILAIGIGPIVQIIFKTVKFDVKNVNHIYIIKSKKST